MNSSIVLTVSKNSAGIKTKLAVAIVFAVLGNAPVFSAQVAEAWSVRQAPPGSTGHEFGALTTDADGNAYVASHSFFPASTWDLVLTKYAAAGGQLWQTRLEAASYRNFASAVAVQGNAVFLAGSSFNENGYGDFQTVKYNIAGTLEWTRRYNGPGNGSDYAAAVAADADGNVIVGGNSAGLTGGVDLAVVKYDAAGNQLWVFRYDGPGQNEEHLAGMKVDAQGNIYLAGTSPDVGGLSAMVTLKLSPDGQPLWTARFRPANDSWQTAIARGLALDGAGNVIVVGDAEGGFLTLKYGPTGNLLWTAGYHAEEPASMSAVDVRVDAANNVVTAGNLYGMGTNDAVLVKYNVDGQQLWVSRVPHPVHAFHLHAIDMDAQGNTYLTGTPYADALTVKVGADGNQLWSAEYSSPGFLYDYGEAIKVDSAGNVFIAGRTFFFTERSVSIVKYRQTAVAGAPVVSVSPASQFVEPGANVTFMATATGTGPLHYQWRFTGRPIPDATGPSLTVTNVQIGNRGDYSVTISNAGAVTISPEARLTMLVKPVVSAIPSNQIAFVGAQAGFSVSFADTGPFNYFWRGTEPFTFQWRHEGTNIPGATHATLRIADLATSDAGGYSAVVSNPAGSVTSSVVSLTVSGAVEQLQVTRSRGPVTGSEDQPLIRVTRTGETIIVGASEGLGTGTDIAILKYGANDLLLWSARFNRDAADPDSPADLVLDPAGNIYLTGYSGWPYVNRVFTTLKYNAEGQLLWARHFQETNAVDSFATSLAVDTVGNVTVAGRAAAIPIVMRYDADGTELWLVRGEDSLYERTQAVVVNASGDTYLGTTVLRGAETDFALRKLNPSGGVVWTRTFDGGGPDRFAAIALDRAENIVMAGSSWTTSLDVVVFKYHADGTRLWSTNFGNSSSEEFVTRALALDGADQIFVAASIEDDDDELGTALLKLDPAGRLLWNALEPDLEVTDRTRMAIDTLGNAYITGTVYRQATANDVATVRYDPAGNRLWLVHYAAAGFSAESGTAVAVDGRGDVHVAGAMTAFTGQGMDLLLLHYLQEDLSGLRIGLARFGDGSFRFSTRPGTNFTVQASSDLIHWTRATDGELQSLLQLRSPNPPPFPKRFFRLARPGGF